MADLRKTGRSTFEFIALFLLLFVTVEFGLRYFFPQQFGNAPTPQPIELIAQSETVREGHHPVLVLRNNTDSPLTLVDRCPQPVVDITYLGAEGATGSGEELVATETALPCSTPVVVSPQSSVTLDLAPWKYSLFSQRGTYRAELSLERTDATGIDAVPATQFAITAAGPFTRLFRAVITKPMLNALIFIASHVPGYNLGIAVILLTLLIKLLLIVPNQHALEGQKKLQELQPRIEELRQKYKDDPKKQQEETLKLWRQHHINPFQSCLPLLIQFPILIGLLYTVQDGAVLQTSQHLLYPLYQDLTWSFNTMFLGLDLTVPSVWILPPLLVVLQFIQMKMALSRRKKKKADVVEPAPKKFNMPEFNQENVMLYFLPLMIGYFAIKFQAAVSLYWGVSTLFGIAQQWYVNKKKL